MTAQAAPADTRKILTEAFTHMLRFLRAKRIPAPDCYDVAQEAALVFLEKLDQIHDPQQSRRFLLGIARMKALQYFERRGRHPSDAFDSHVLPRGTAPTTPSVRLDRKTRLLNVLQALDDEPREAFLLRCEGLKLEEIAAEMKLSLATVKRRLADANAELARQTRALTPELDDEQRVVAVEAAYRGS
ncbi:MAG TPA: RNA polymerase sigma factor [Nannocystis sp.]|jgi:RNA polymerase sigma factor (sigma-70 family)